MVNWVFALLCDVGVAARLELVLDVSVRLLRDVLVTARPELALAWYIV
jgi:hypothetical protein